jgi:hypothetical protein
MRKGVGSKLSAHPLSRPRSQSITPTHSANHMAQHPVDQPPQPDFSITAPPSRRPTTSASPRRPTLNGMASHRLLHRPSTSLSKQGAGVGSRLDENRGLPSPDEVVEVELPGPLNLSNHAPSSTSPTKSTTSKVKRRSRAPLVRPHTASVANVGGHPDDPDHPRSNKFSGLTRRSIQG